MFFSTKIAKNVSYPLRITAFSPQVRLTDGHCLCYPGHKSVIFDDPISLLKISYQEIFNPVPLPVYLHQTQMRQIIIVLFSSSMLCNTSLYKDQIEENFGLIFLPHLLIKIGQIENNMSIIGKLFE